MEAFNLGSTRAWMAFHKYMEHSWEGLNGAWSCGRCVQGNPVLCRRMFTSRGRCFGNCLLVKRFLSYGYFITAGLILDLPLVIARWMDSNGYNLQLYNIYFYTCNKLRRVGCSLLVFIGIVTRDSNENWKSYYDTQKMGRFRGEAW